VFPTPEAEIFAPVGGIVSQVQIELDAEPRDRYGRLLAYVWLNGEMLNRRLLAEPLRIAPNVRYAAESRAPGQGGAGVEPGIVGGMSTNFPCQSTLPNFAEGMVLRCTLYWSVPAPFGDSARPSSQTATHFSLENFNSTQTQFKLGQAILNLIIEEKFHKL